MLFGSQTWQWTSTIHEYMLCLAHLSIRICKLLVCMYIYMIYVYKFWHTYTRTYPHTGYTWIYGLYIYIYVYNNNYIYIYGPARRPAARRPATPLPMLSPPKPPKQPPPRGRPAIYHHPSRSHMLICYTYVLASCHLCTTKQDTSMQCSLLPIICPYNQFTMYYCQ